MPASTLVVVDQLATLGQSVESGKEVVVVRAGAAVENNRRGAFPDSALEEGDAANRVGAGLSRGQPSSPHLVARCGHREDGGKVPRGACPEPFAPLRVNSAKGSG